MDVKGDMLTITVDLSKRFGPSKTGKTMIVATSAGNVSIPGKPSIKCGLNVYEAR
jgi:hypothetical protein